MRLHRALRARLWYALDCPPTMRPRDVLRGILWRLRPHRAI